MEQKQHQRHEISTEIIYLEPPVAIGYLCLAPTCELPSIRVNQYLAIPFLPIPPTTYPSLSPSSPISASQFLFPSRSRLFIFFPFKFEPISFPRLGRSLFSRTQLLDSTRQKGSYALSLLILLILHYV